MQVLKNTRALMVGAVAVGALALCTAAPAAAEQVEVFSAGGTFNSTAESGTGAMTSNASASGLGAAPQEEPNQVIVDNFGRVNGALDVTGGSTYRVTTTLSGARANESATGGATARGFVEVELYDCCFAGEATLLTSKEAELPSQPGQVEVVQEVYLPRDSSLTPNVLLHSYAAADVDTVDTASVDSSTQTTTIDISPVDGPNNPPGGSNPPPSGGKGGGLLGSLLGNVGKVAGISQDKKHGTATLKMKMLQPAEVSVAGSNKVRPASKATQKPRILRLKVSPRKDDLRRLTRKAERKGRAELRVKVRVKCDPEEGRAYSTKGHIRLVLKG